MAKTLYTGSVTVGTQGGQSNAYVFDAEVIENSTSTANNTSNVTCNLYGKGINGWSYASHWDPVAYINIDGSRKVTEQISSLGSSRKLLCSWTGDIVHGDDGKKSIRVTFNFSAEGDTTYYIPANAKITADPVNLTDIPRYATINSFTVAKRDETSLSFSFTANATCDYAWYSTNNGSTWTGVDIADGTSGSFNVTGLSANTSYNCKLRVRRKDSQLNTDSNVVSQTTYDYPKVSAIGSNPLNIGNQQTLTLYNPLGRNVTVKMYKDNTSGTELYSGTTNTTQIKFTPNATTLYNSIPNNQSGNCVYSVIYGNITKTTNVATYQINGNENPVFDASDWSFTADKTALTNNNQNAIDNYATLTVNINNPATSSYGANIDKYAVKWGTGETKYIQAGSSSVTVTGNGDTLSVIVYDKRGLQKETLKTIANISYEEIRVNNIDTLRTNGVEAEVKLNLSGEFYNNTFGSNGVQNALYSAKYWTSTNQTFSGNGYTIPLNNFVINNNDFNLTDYNIHANGSSGGFPVGTKYYVKIEIKDAQGLLSTYTGIITITDGKIARDVYQDVNGDYHTGINGLADSNYTENIHGSLNATDIYKNGTPLANVATSGSYNDLTDKPDTFPIGSIIETYTSANPNGTYGGTWQRYGTGRVTVDVDTSDSNFNTIGKNSGANSNSYTPAGTIGGTAITVDQMPSHNHIMYGWPNKGNLSGDGIYAVQDNTYGTGGPNGRFKQEIATQNKGGGKTHTHSWTGTASNISTIQKSITVYRWRRTA